MIFDDKAQVPMSHVGSIFVSGMFAIIVLFLVAYFSPVEKYDIITTEYPLEDIQLRHYEGSFMPFDHSHDYYTAVYRNTNGVLDEVYSDRLIDFELRLTNKSSVEIQKRVVSGATGGTTTKWRVNIQSYSQIRNVGVSK